MSITSPRHTACYLYVTSGASPSYVSYIQSKKWPGTNEKNWRTSSQKRYGKMDSHNPLWPLLVALVQAYLVLEVYIGTVVSSRYIAYQHQKHGVWWQMGSFSPFANAVVLSRIPIHHTTSTIHHIGYCVLELTCRCMYRYFEHVL